MSHKPPTPDWQHAAGLSDCALYMLAHAIEQAGAVDAVHYELKRFSQDIPAESPDYDAACKALDRLAMVHRK